MSGLVHVAVAVIRDEKGRVLIARRPESVHQGGKLEFPGGKVEAGESVQQALQRELYEELGIQVDATTMQPLIKIHHHYADKSVCLDVWQVLAFSGEVADKDGLGKEGQPIFWFEARSLVPKDFPAANAPIITALNLPSQLMISPDIVGDVDEIVAQIRARIEWHNIKAAILRLPRVSSDHYVCIAEQLVGLYPQLLWQVHGDIDLARRLGTGLHLSSKSLMVTDAEQLSGLGSISASAHNTDELKQAKTLGIDFAVLGSVQATTTHPNEGTLGWPSFAEMVDTACIPVYALGGMQVKDVPRALSCGAQGIAGISLFEAG